MFQVIDALRNFNVELILFAIMLRFFGSVKKINLRTETFTFINRLNY